MCQFRQWFVQKTWKSSVLFCAIVFSSKSVKTLEKIIPDLYIHCVPLDWGCYSPPSTGGPVNRYIRIYHLSDKYDFFSSAYDSLLSVASTVKLSSSLTSISLASPTEKNSLQNPFWYSLDGDDSFVGTVAANAAAGPVGGELRAEKRGAYYALAKNPDKYVSYQQAQQQTEDSDPPDYADVCEENITEDVIDGIVDNENDDIIADDDNENDHDENDDDSEKIIHL